EKSMRENAGDSDSGIASRVAEAAAAETKRAQQHCCCALEHGGWESFRPRRRRLRAQCSPQTSSAVSITSLSFAACDSRAISLPCTVLEKPHCGERQSCSSGT